MNAWIVAVGTELVRFGHADTNGDWLQARLAEIGIDVRGRSVVGDDPRNIADQIRLVYELALCRQPTADELADAQPAVRDYGLST